MICTSLSFGQHHDYINQLDSLFSQQTEERFNGVVAIAEHGEIIYSKAVGYAHIDQKDTIQLSDQFVVGSISKQFTAALILMEVEKGNLDLYLPIRAYLPELTASWADTVTIHHLLTHTHGIQQTDAPLSFEPGTQFMYSQTGYRLLGSILEHVTNTSFSELSMHLFQSCGMYNTYHPEVPGYNDLVSGYTQAQNGDLLLESGSLENYPAAGSFISTAGDLLTWSTKLFHAQIIGPETLLAMQTSKPGAIRDHPIFGITQYGYGITIDTSDALIQIGQTGYAPGFVSMLYYFPLTETCVVVLENVAYNTTNLKDTFHHHTETLGILRKALRNHP